MKSNRMFRIVIVDNDVISFVDLKILQTPEEEKLDSTLLLTPSIDTKLNYFKKQNREPIIVITNPKENQFYLPSREPDLNKNSTFIRMFIWSVFEVQNITISLNDALHNEQVDYKGTGKSWQSLDPSTHSPFLPLYISKWDPSSLKVDANHNLKVVVFDKNNNKAEKIIVFRIDGKRPNVIDISFLANWFISTSFPLIVNIFNF